MEKCLQQSEKLSQELLKEYKEIINKILYKHYIPEMYREDLENDLLYIIYKADKDFNGVGSLHGYRKTMIGYYIKNFLSKIKKEKRLKTEKLHENIEDKVIIELDYLSSHEKQILLDRYVFKSPMSSFSKEERKMLKTALEKVRHNENIN